MLKTGSADFWCWIVFVSQNPQIGIAAKNAKKRYSGQNCQDVSSSTRLPRPAPVTFVTIRNRRSFRVLVQSIQGSKSFTKMLDQWLRRRWFAGDDFHQPDGRKLPTTAMNVPCEPVAEFRKFPRGETRLEITQFVASSCVELGCVDVAQCVGRKVTQQTSAPVKVFVLATETSSPAFIWSE